MLSWILGLFHSHMDGPPQPPVFPTNNSTASPQCPYCGHTFDKRTGGKRKCPSCGNTIRSVRKFLLTEEQYAQVKADEARQTIAYFTAMTQYNLAQMSASEIRKVEIACTLDSRSCEFCNSVDGRKFPINAIPPEMMPPHNCQCEPWCRCSLVAVL